VEFNITNSWATTLAKEIEKPYFKAINAYIDNAIINGAVIYPKVNEVYNALALCPLENTKVVILGQDPYHAPKQANGLAFSVQAGTKLPPSLKNIFKELATDLQCPIPNNGCLDSWAKQGVLLLNSALTVEDNKPMSHAKIGWETFTDAIIEIVNKQYSNVVFILWGKLAQSKIKLIDANKHLVIESAHPSPLSAYNGFWGSKPFSKTNAYLLAKGKQAINWQLGLKD
jgi:uracil-DNA glycosylase